ncbi:MAG: hypothetical protein JWQ66_3241 [Mucilaginibacter sp.]|nr:hypothetical protein [Mucilaginibacter sp.]
MTYNNPHTTEQKIRAIISEYLENYFRLVNAFDAIREGKEAAETIEAHRKRQLIVDEFNTDAGIVGGAMIFADITRNTQVILQEKSIDTPFTGYYHIGWKFQDGDIAAKKDLIQAIVHSSSLNKSFKTKNILNFPKYFLNLPQEEWPSALPRTKFEKEVVAEQNINYLFCLVDEILFFNYAWRYLIRLARVYGLDRKIKPEDLDNNSNDSNIIKDILKTAFWEKYSSLPEYELKTMLSELADNPDWQNVDQFFDGLFGGGVLSYSGDVFNQEKEWRYLGLPYKTEDHQIRQKTLMNLRQLLRYCEELFRNEGLIGRLKSEYQTIRNAGTEIDEWISGDADSAHIRTIEKNYEQAYAFVKNNQENINSALLKLIYTLLTDTIKNKKNEAWVSDLEMDKTYTVGNLLTVLHARSRFPILQSYFLTFLHGNSVVHDYFTFPLLVSKVYTVDATNFSKAKGELMKLNKVVLMSAFIEPIWTNKAFLNDGYFLKEETQETVKGFKLNQLFYQKISRKTMDQGFYGTYFSDALWKEIFKDLEHSQKHYFNAIASFPDAYQLDADATRVLLLYKDMLKGFLEISKHAGNLSEYIRLKGAPEHFNLLEDLDFAIDTTLLILANPKTSGTFKVEPAAFVAKGKSLFKRSYSTPLNLLVCSHRDLAQLLIKDVLVNAVDHCLESDPKITIHIKERRRDWLLRVTNNASILKQDFIDLKDPSLKEGKVGFRIIKAITQALGWKLILPKSYAEIETSGNFFVEFEIPKP